MQVRQGIEKKVGRLKKDPQINCSCGAVFRIDAKQLRKAVGPIDDDPQGKLF